MIVGCETIQDQIMSTTSETPSTDSFEDFPEQYMLNLLDSDKKRFKDEILDLVEQKYRLEFMKIKDVVDDCYSRIEKLEQSILNRSPLKQDLDMLKTSEPINKVKLLRTSINKIHQELVIMSQYVDKLEEEIEDLKNSTVPKPKVDESPKQLFSEKVRDLINYSCYIVSFMYLIFGHAVLLIFGPESKAGSGFRNIFKMYYPLNAIICAARLFQEDKNIGQWVLGALLCVILGVVI
ncbi:hypothetical protein DFJ63DRAFT_314480 [Scheffersomyces coipomensis]|uniref:uncharacterized protein n=1 Tax=Scheffersomyces coipomensis TaxID=1788519 RepID=UPI00315D5B6D